MRIRRTLRYRSEFGFMITNSGLSAISPPWTTMTLYDLNVGQIKWQMPLGEVPELAAKARSDTGGHFPKVGPVVTAGGLIFTGTRDRYVRALDADTGKEIWRTELGAGIEGIPAIYEVARPTVRRVLRCRPRDDAHACVAERARIDRADPGRLRRAGP